MSTTITMHLWVWVFMMVVLGFQMSVIWRLQRDIRSFRDMMLKATAELKACERVIAEADRAMRSKR